MASGQWTLRSLHSRLAPSLSRLCSSPLSLPPSLPLSLSLASLPLSLSRVCPSLPLCISRSLAISPLSLSLSSSLSFLALVVALSPSLALFLLPSLSRVSPSLPRAFPSSGDGQWVMGWGWWRIPSCHDGRQRPLRSLLVARRDVAVLSSAGTTSVVTAETVVLHFRIPSPSLTISPTPPTSPRFKAEWCRHSVHDHFSHSSP